MKKLHTALAWSALALSLGVSHAQEVQPASSMRLVFNLREMPMDVALQEFGTVTGWQVLYPSHMATDKKSPAVVGTMSPQEALKKLLEGSSLRPEMINEKTVAIRETGRAKNTDDVTPVKTTYLLESSDRFLLAQSEPVNSPNSDVEASRDQSGKAQEKIAEVVVTGTHIRNTEAVGSEYIILDRKYIENSGYATIEDVIRTLPQAAAGPNAQRPDVGMPSSNSLYANFGRGSGVNLRGLGAGATLVLIDGRRQASTGTGGTFVDISSIPLSAVERVEVVADGGSAIYGSDAVGGVVNVVLRKNISGFETRLDYSTMDGDSSEVKVAQLAGSTWHSGSAFLGLEYYKRGSLLATDRDFSANSDQRANGGDNFSSITSSPGNIICTSPAAGCVPGKPAYAVPSGQDGTHLSASNLIKVAADGTGTNYQNSAIGSALVPDDTRRSVFLRFNQEFGGRYSAFVNARYNNHPFESQATNIGAALRVPTSNPYFVNPFPPAPFVVVAYAFGVDYPVTIRGHSDTYDFSTGLTSRMAADWEARVTLSYTRQSTDYTQEMFDTNLINDAIGLPPAPSRAATAYSPAANGYLNPFSGEPSQHNHDVLAKIVSLAHQGFTWKNKNAEAVFDGPIFRTTAGEARLAVGYDYRQEDGDTGYSAARTPPLKQDVRAAFTELVLPIIGRDNALPGADELKVSAAGRYEEYLGYRNTFNPQFGLNWKPVPSLNVRGKWGTSFRAPTPADRDTTVFNVGVANVFTNFPDPKAPGGATTALVLNGVNPSLHEETAKSWSTGFDFKPAQLTGFQLSTTYYSTSYTDRIGVGGFPGQQLTILQSEAVWQDIITRSPSAELVSSVCAGATIRAVNCATSNPGVLIDFRVRNIAVQNTRGIDLQLSQAFKTPRGEWDFSTNVTKVLKDETGLSKTTPRVDVLDTPGNPLAWRARASTTWTLGAFEAGATLNYWPSYKNPFGGTSGASASDVASWTTLDLGVSYKTQKSAGWLGGLELAANVVNVFDRDPPYLNNILGFDYASANPYGRLISARISKSL